MTVPVEVLISEHKLILQTVELVKKETKKVDANKKVDPLFIGTIVDFFRTYADRFHHGKEEGILFSELSRKQLNEAHNKMMNELVMEHAFARRTVTELEHANELYVLGKPDAVEKVLELLDTLVHLYPMHIDKEDNNFFFPVMAYFSEHEQKEMLSSFLSFNEDFTDKRYKQLILSLE